MKRIHIIGLVMMAVAIFLIITAGQKVATYVNFNEAALDGGSVKVIGNLVKDKPIYYDELKDPNYFSFYMLDKDSVEKKVILNQGKPNDFELSEQIVLTGQMVDNEFVASDMLLKCPSKYKDEEVKLKEQG